MAQFTITVPDAIVPRVLDALCGQYGYQATLPDGTPNPETRAQFARGVLRRFVRESVLAWEAQQAAETARAAALEQSNRDITLT